MQKNRKSWQLEDTKKKKENAFYHQNEHPSASQSLLETSLFALNILLVLRFIWVTLKIICSGLKKTIWPLSLSLQVIL